jgi:hypothetical protein
MAPADERHGGVERQLREAILTGQLVDLREGDTSADAAARGSQWSAGRTVPAVVLVDLLTRGDGPAQPRALRLAGARIAGRLDLEAAHLACPVLLLDCWFEESVALSEATVPALRLPGCHLPALDAEQLTTRGNVDLRHGFHARGEVNLGGAHLGGSLILDGAILSNPGGRALYADRLTVDQAMLCQEGFSVHGAVHLEGARIGGSLTGCCTKPSRMSGRGLCNSQDRHVAYAGQEKSWLFTETLKASGTPSPSVSSPTKCSTSWMRIVAEATSFPSTNPRNRSLLTRVWTSSTPTDTSRAVKLTLSTLPDST